VRRGDLYWFDDAPGGRHPVVIVARSAALPYLTYVTVALVTSTLRDLPSRVRVGESHGLPHESDINCDVLFPARRAELTEPISSLDLATLRRLDSALAVALALEVRAA
jgi:mRNA interferase MazF